MKKLLMFAASGLLAPAGTAVAEVQTPEVTMVIPSAVNDKAPISGTRLRRTNEEQPGNEMPAAALFEGNKQGLYFAMTTELPPLTAGGPVRAARHRMQLSAVPFTLEQDAVTNKVKVVADISQSKFVTDNTGNEYRNANAPVATAVLGGKLILAKYNYQAAGSNDTKGYVQLFNKAGEAVLGQTLAIAKNNDDCSMHQDGAPWTEVVTGPTSARIVTYAGCNGNGRDDGWAFIHDLNCNAELTNCTFTKVADVSLAQREERSRGRCTVADADPNTAICTWTEGNTQPQRDGTWMAAVNIGEGENGAEAQSRVLWKKQIDGRRDVVIEGNNLRTYSMRAMHERIQTVDATTGKLVNTNQIIWRSGDLRGNNNNNEKGGTYIRSQMAVIEATAAGMSYVAPLTDVAPKLLGLDGTHLGMSFGLFGTTNALVPGVVFLGGSHTGGGSSAQARVVTWDAATSQFADAAMIGVAPHDRHLYPNYLGNNPGNQGRNHSQVQMIANPYVGQNGNTDAYLMLLATTGKAPVDMMNPERKLSAYLSVLPIAQTPRVTTPGGSGSGEEPEEPGTPEEPTTPDDGTEESGQALGGCSTTGGTGGLVSFLLIGMAALIRRRR